MITAACAAIIACPAASAADRTGSSVGYALTAVGFRSYFAFDTHPGHTVRGLLRVTNLSPVARSIVLAPVDVSTAAAGGLQYGQGPPQKEGRWLTLASDSIRLSGHGTSNIPFTARVSHGARPGDHFGLSVDDRR